MSRSGWRRLALFVVPCATILGTAQAQSIIEETDRRMHELYDDQGCLRTEGCGDYGTGRYGGVPHYGVLYLSEDGRDYGIAWDYQYADEADAEARSQCSGACRRVVDTANACISIVRSERSSQGVVYYAVDGHHDDTEATAMQRCEAGGLGGCVLETSVCGGTPFGSYRFQRIPEWVGVDAMSGNWIVRWDGDAANENRFSIHQPYGNDWFEGSFISDNGTQCEVSGPIDSNDATVLLEIECADWRLMLKGDASNDAQYAVGTYIWPDNETGRFEMWKTD